MSLSHGLHVHRQQAAHTGHPWSIHGLWWSVWIPTLWQHGQLDVSRGSRLQLVHGVPVERAVLVIQHHIVQPVGVPHLRLVVQQHEVHRRRSARQPSATSHGNPAARRSPLRLRHRPLPTLGQRRWQQRRRPCLLAQTSYSCVYMILDWTWSRSKFPWLQCTPVATKLSLKRVRAKALEPVACARQVVRACMTACHWEICMAMPACCWA